MKFVKTTEINIAPQQVNQFLDHAKDLTQQQIITFLGEYINPSNEPDKPVRMIRKIVTDPIFDFLWEPKQGRLIKEVCAKAIPEVTNGIHVNLTEYRQYPEGVKKSLLKAFETSENRRSVLAEIFLSKPYRNFRNKYIADRREDAYNWQ